jgi:hypothetical protein
LYSFINKMVFSWEHDIKVTKSHQNLLPTQSVIVVHTVVNSHCSSVQIKLNIHKHIIILGVGVNFIGDVITIVCHCVINIENLYNLFQNQKSTNTAFYLENTTDNVANFCF